MKLFVTLLSLATLAACGDGSSTGAPMIVGDVNSTSSSALTRDVDSDTCRDLRISVNGEPMLLAFGDECDFMIPAIPTGEITLDVEVEGIRNSIHITEVADNEIVELAISTANDGLSVSVSRRIRASENDDSSLPEVIEHDHVTVFLQEGVYSHKLNVNGRDFTLIGSFQNEAEDCDSGDWTSIDGNVIVSGDNAVFRNIRFDGNVIVVGKRPRFINCCFGDTRVALCKEPRGRGRKDDD